MTTNTLSNLSTKRVVEPLPRPIISKETKVAVDTLPCWILLRQQAPLTACHHEVQNPIDNPSHIQCRGRPPGFAGGINSLIQFH